MSDLIARLRKDRDDGRSDDEAFLKWEAADELERLTKSPQAPIALLTVNETGVAGVTMFAPGLPPGDHRLYCEPEATAPHLRECKHEHGSGIMDTNGNGEFACHECGHVQKLGRGLPDQP